MAVTILSKHSLTTTDVPNNLAAGELAVNVADKKLWVGDGVNAVPLFVLAGPGADVDAADVTYLDTHSIGDTNVQGALDLAVDLAQTNETNISNITNGTTPVAEADNADTVDSYHILVNTAGSDANTIYIDT